MSCFSPNNKNADDMGMIETDGILVQEYGPIYIDGLESGGGKWETICPLVDYPFLYPDDINRLPKLR